MPCNIWGFPGGTSDKESPANAGDIRDVGLIHGLERSPGGNGNPLQYSRLENPMDRGSWQAIVQRVAQSQTLLKWLSMHAWHMELGIKPAPPAVEMQRFNNWTAREVPVILLIVLAGDAIPPELVSFLISAAVLIHLTLSYFLQIKCECAVNPMCQLFPGLLTFCLGARA